MIIQGLDCMQHHDEITILLNQTRLLRRALTEISNTVMSGNADADVMKAIALAGLIEADMERARLIEILHPVPVPPVPYRLPIAA